MNCQALTSLSLGEVYFVLAVQVMNDVASRDETLFHSVVLKKSSSLQLLADDGQPARKREMLKHLRRESINKSRN
jgi:hypothetical protein